jgi:hypothetical protein
MSGADGDLIARLSSTGAIHADVDAVRAIADPFARERAARSAIEAYRQAMMDLGQLRSETVHQLLEHPPDGMGREDIARRLGLQNVSYLYALARPAKKLSKPRGRTGHTRAATKRPPEHKAADAPTP